MPESPEKTNPLTALFLQAGISTSLLQKVRFRGPVGKLALIAVLGVISLGGVGVRTPTPFIQGLCAVLVTLVILSIGAAIVWYSHMHPREATLEGMEVVVLEQQKAWAAKGVDLPTNVPVLPNPGGAPPLLNPPLDPDE